MKLRFRPGISILEKEHDQFHIRSERTQIVIKNLSLGCKEAFLSLAASPITEEQLINTLYEKSPAADPAFLFYYLERFRKVNLLSYSTQLWELIPLNPHFDATFTLPSSSFHLSRFAVLRMENEELLIETPLAAARLKLLDPKAMQLLFLLKTNNSYESLLEKLPEVSQETLKESLSLLNAAKLLAFEEESQALQQWEFHDLYFHSRSREGRHNTPFGGTFRFKEVLPPPSCLKPSDQGSCVKLHQPNDANSFFKLLEQRKSLRHHGKKPITVQALSSLLFHCARVKAIQKADQEEFAFRPYPGGGARYELEIYPIIYACQGLEKGVYHYHPGEHHLYKISELTQEAEKLLGNACASSGMKEYPQVLLVISARFQRVAWKYQSIAYATILKNVGVLLQTLYLGATSLGLSPCALGGGDSDLFCRVVGTDYFEETSVGEFMLGSKEN